MDEERRAAWEAAFAKLREGLQIWEIPSEEHYALLPQGLFEGMNEVEAIEEALFVVRYWLHGQDLSPIPPRGLAEADNWFAMQSTWLEKRQAEKLRAMIEASGQDPDYWEALNLIAVRLHKNGMPFPDDLADWVIELHKWAIDPCNSGLEKPPQHRGKPYYANANRDSSIADVFSLLDFLGLESKEVRYSVIAESLLQDKVLAGSKNPQEVVRKAIESADEFDGKLPSPWECWPSPQANAERRKEAKRRKRSDIGNHSGL